MIQNSRACDVVTMITAFRKLKERIGGKNGWAGTFEEQRTFADMIEHFAVAIRDMRITSLASSDANELNKFLETHQLEGRFDPFDQSSHEFGAAATIAEKDSWVVPGVPTTTLIGRDLYEAFQIDMRCCEFLHSDCHQAPIIRLRTKNPNGAVCFLTPALGEDLDGIKLAQKIIGKLDSSARKIANGSGARYDGIICPKAVLDIKPDMNFLLGLATADPDNEIWKITQAFQQIKFSLDELGFDVKVGSGAAAAKTVGLTLALQNPFVIREPFFCWVTQKQNGERIGLPVAPMIVGSDAWIPVKTTLRAIPRRETHRINGGQRV